ncbi:MAG: hypothetical protein PVG49_17890 [Desulfobacteraceae bacterium]|jgi:hypothetical protein
MLRVEVENRIKAFNPWILDPEKAADFINRFLLREYVVRAAQQMPLQKNRGLWIVKPRQAGKSTIVEERVRFIHATMENANHDGLAKSRSTACWLRLNCWNRKRQISRSRLFATPS